MTLCVCKRSLSGRVGGTAMHTWGMQWGNRTKEAMQGHHGPQFVCCFANIDGQEPGGFGP